MSYRFFIGIGAQRSGTTWLSHYLRTHPQVGFSPLKEVRFFDSIYCDELKGVVRNRLQTRLLLKGLARSAVLRPLTTPRLAWHALGVRRHNPESYRAYMRALTHGKHIGGEITPSYASLPTDAIKVMDELLDRPLYLMSLRNPADRLMSEISFRRNRLGLDGETANEDTSRIVAERLVKSMHLDFAGAIARYENVSGPERLHVLFYEHLFDPALQKSVLDGITDYLGIAPHPSRIAHRVNAAPPLSAEGIERAVIVRTLERQYRFAQERFGDALPESWQRDIALI